MSNTSLRILSAVVLIAFVVAAFVMGKWTMLALVWGAGVLCIDELLINFAKGKRNQFIYYYVMSFFTVIFVLANVYAGMLAFEIFTIIALVFNIFLIYYLFKVPQDLKLLKRITEHRPGNLPLLVILPLFSFGIHFKFEFWKESLVILLMVTYAMDTGAWFIGKNFGRRKLWPAVSPNKTVEGLIGGMCFASFFGSVAWWILFKDYRVDYSIIFAICGALSQIGDLIQSKIKREFQIKDSSQLIPGHGGVYDRIDSLIFLSPFFVIVVKYLQA